jgi:antitoxin component YwqK of YwqJK toxin-antitoxin module
MKIYFSIILVLTFLNGTEAQQTEKLDYCNCIAKIDQELPFLNGKYESTCKGTLIETGNFKGGNKDGEWVTYSRKGIVIRRINYTEGKLNGKSELFYFNGANRLVASFANGKQNGIWTYFTSKGKVFMQGEYESGKPIKIWTINNEKGNKPSIQYDFNASKLTLNDEIKLHKDGSIIQNDNTGEYYILRYPKRNPADGTAPLGGFLLASDLFTDLVEIPLDYWDTYISYTYKVKFKVLTNNESDFSIEPTASNFGNTEIFYPFLVNTNPDSKIKRVDHTELSKKLLLFKINEAINFLPPWIYKDKSDVNIYIPYVINRILDFSKPVDREYN